MPCDGEPVPIWRFDVAAKVGIVRFNDQPRARIVQFLQNDMNVVVALVLRPGNPSDDLINVEFLLADAVIPARTAVSRNGVERSYARFNGAVQPNTAGAEVTQALHVGAVEGTTRSKRNKRDQEGKTGARLAQP